MDTKQVFTEAGRDIEEMMRVWEVIEAESYIQFPDIDDDERFIICSNAMKNALGLDELP